MQVDLPIITEHRSLCQALDFGSTPQTDFQQLNNSMFEFTKCTLALATDKSIFKFEPSVSLPSLDASISLAADMLIFEFTKPHHWTPLYSILQSLHCHPWPPIPTSLNLINPAISPQSQVLILQIWHLFSFSLWPQAPSHPQLRPQLWTISTSISKHPTTLWKWTSLSSLFNHRHLQQVQVQGPVRSG